MEYSAQVQQLAQGILSACHALQDPVSRERAEALLLELRHENASLLLPAARLLLETCHEPVVCFQAASAVQDAVLRDAQTLSITDHLSLQRYLLEYAVSQAACAQGQQFVRTKVLAVLAVLIKRTWLETSSEAKEQLFTHLEDLISGASQPAAIRRCGLALLDSLLSEFSPSTASLLGLPIDHHVRCHSSFQNLFLRRIFNMGLVAAKSSFHTAMQQSSMAQQQQHMQVPASLAEERDSLAAAVRLSSSVLFWDFNQGSSMQRLRRRGGRSKADEELSSASTLTDTVAIQPGEEWREVLLSGELADFLKDLYGQLPVLYSPTGAARGGSGSALGMSEQAGSGMRNEEWRDEPLAVHSRQLMVQLCCLSGPLLSSSTVAVAGTVSPRSTTVDQTLQAHHLTKVLPLIFQLLYPTAPLVLAVATGSHTDSELLDGCRGLSALLRMHPSAATTTFPGCPTSLLGLLVQLCCSVAEAHGLQCNMRQLQQVALHTETAEAEEEEDAEERRNSISQALYILLDSWQPLLMAVASSKGARQQQQQQQTAQETELLRSMWGAVGEGAAVVFHKYSHAELMVSVALADKEEDAEDYFQVEIEAREERMSLGAQVGRAAVGAALDSTLALLEKAKAELLEAVGQQRDPAAAMEQLYWLVGMAAHLLADEASGETPLVPPSVVALVASAAPLPVSWVQGHGPTHLPTAACSVESLPMAVLQIASAIQDPASRSSILSPRLFSASLSFFARWGPTYMLLRKPKSTSEEASGGAAANGQAAAAHLSRGHHGNGTHSRQEDEEEEGEEMAASRDRGLLLLWGLFSCVDLDVHTSGVRIGPTILQAVLSSAVTALTFWSAEPDIQYALCRELLPALTRHKPLCAALSHTGGWQELETAFKQRHPALVALPGPCQRAVSGALVQAAGYSSQDMSACQEAVRALLDPLVSSLRTISSSPTFASERHKPQVIQQVEGVLECLRGSANATAPSTHAVGFAAGMALADTILALLSAYQHEPRVVYLILKYLTVWVEAQVLFLSPADTARLFSLCQSVLQSYASFTVGKVSLEGVDASGRHTQASILEATSAVRYKDLKALLTLLCSLTSKDIVDFGEPSAAGPGQPPDVSQMIHLGLHTIVPLMSQHLLGYPKLSHLYFTLVEHVLSVHPDKMLQLPPSVLENLLTTLCFGLQNDDEDVQLLTLAGVAALASFHLQARSQGQQGLMPILLPASAIQQLQSQSSPSPTTPAFSSGGQLEANQPLPTAFLSILLRLLLTHFSSPATVEAAADALLPLMLSQQEQTQELMGDLVQSVHEAASRRRLSDAASILLAAASLAALQYQQHRHHQGLLRQARQKFRAAVLVFWADAGTLVARK